MDENIFEAVSRQGKERRNKSLQGKSEASAAKKKEDKPVDPEIGVMLDKMKFMKQDLEVQLSDVYQKGKESNINVSLLVESASGLTASQLEKMKEQEKILNDNFNIAVPAESCLKKPEKT
ncbi:MAG TPA: hypothetical protein VGP47_03345, partial [Parachlamydiaceae bacterium]|nr:hypothetical protein [Parachlamydiaceae bacterium]